MVEHAPPRDEKAAAAGPSLPQGRRRGGEQAAAAARPPPLRRSPARPAPPRRALGTGTNRHRPPAGHALCRPPRATARGGAAVGRRAAPPRPAPAGPPLRGRGRREASPSAWCSPPSPPPPRRAETHLPAAERGGSARCPKWRPPQLHPAASRQRPLPATARPIRRSGSRSLTAASAADRRATDVPLPRPPPAEGE